MASVFENILAPEDLDVLLALPEVVTARQRLDGKRSGTVDVSVPLPPTMKAAVGERLGLDLGSTVPMRWIKGDTHAHTDRAAAAFDRTYLMYATDSPGSLIVDGATYPIARGTGYVFDEGMRHETVGTGDEPRLLLGPMSERGMPVGGPVEEEPFIISVPAGVTIKFRQSGDIIEYSINGGESWNSDQYFPIMIENNNLDGAVTVEFTTDMVLTEPNNYFICGTGDINFGTECLRDDGSRPVIDVSGVVGYPGLVQNGTADEDGHSGVRIQNLEVAATNSTLAVGCGWLAQPYYGKNQICLILHCHSTGDISQFGGGIVGQYAGANVGILTIDLCSSTGSIGLEAGGIVGTNAGSSVGLIKGAVTVTRCFSTGTINNDAGGILGVQQDCGAISITNCYSQGSIGENGGGIVGRYPCTNSGTITIQNCYSEGSIGVDAGGIVGAGGNNIQITNCYILGAGSIAGTNTSFISSSIYYTEGGAWSDNDANAVLLNVPTTSFYGNSWVSVGTNMPYKLSAFGFSPYSICPSPIRTISGAAGLSTTGGVLAGYTYSLLDIEGQMPTAFPTISINSSSGIITTSPATPPGFYKIKVFSTKNPYSITDWFITLTGSPTDSACCVTAEGMAKKPYDTRADITIGKSLILGPSLRPLTFDERAKIIKARSAQRA